MLWRPVPMKLRPFHGLLLGASLAFPGVAQAGGHWWCIDNCANVPKGAQPAPAGTYINKIIQIQDSKAEMDDFVIYKHMWYMGGTQLGPLGRYQLDLIAKRLPTVPFPVVVATSKNDGLDESRREAIVAMLRTRGIDDPGRVVIAFPIAEGLYGEESYFIYNRLLFGGQYGTGFG